MFSIKDVGIVYDPIYTKHNTGYHPEKSDRVIVTLEQLIQNQMYGDERLSYYHQIVPRKVDLEQVKWCHSNKLIENVNEMVSLSKNSNILTRLDGNTIISPDSLDASLKAVGGNLSAIDAICDRKIERAFVLCRPPGHHSNSNFGRGFCVFNNVMIAAEYLFRIKKMKKVAIIDFDAHAGNGSEEIINAGTISGDVLFFSLHQHPDTLYPGTCYAHEIGTGKNIGKIINLTFAPRSGEKSVDYSFQHIINPILTEFQPEFILISAGFDAHIKDPLTSMGYVEQTYSMIMKYIGKISEKFAKNRICCTLEGGYNIEALSKSVANVISTMATEKGIFEEEKFEELSTVTEYTQEKLIPELQKILKPFWKNI